jgi:hypothetical protein
LPFGAPRALILLADMHRVRQAMPPFQESPLVEHTIAVMNASLAAMNMNIAAEALGIASVMLTETGHGGLLDAGYLRDRLALPPRVVPLCTIVFGQAAGSYPLMPPKLPLKAIAFPRTYRGADRADLVSWLAQMRAGYKASHPSSSLEKQLEVYSAKIGKAEADLRTMVLAPRNDVDPENSTDEATPNST